MVIVTTALPGCLRAPGLFVSPRRMDLDNEPKFAAIFGEDDCEIGDRREHRIASDAAFIGDAIDGDADPLVGR
jgi:hypothetical protein